MFEINMTISERLRDIRDLKIPSPLSIDEKLSIINIEVVLERYFDDCVVIKVLKLSKVI